MIHGNCARQKEGVCGGRSFGVGCRSEKFAFGQAQNLFKGKVESRWE